LHSYDRPPPRLFVMLVLAGVWGCAFLEEPDVSPTAPRSADTRHLPAKQPPVPLAPQARAESPPTSAAAQPRAITDEEGLGRGPLGRAGVLLDRAIAGDEAVRKSGGVVDATLLANLRMTKQARDLMASGDTERAADLLERAIAMDDGQGYAYLYLGYLHLSVGRRDQAEVFLARAAGLLPRDPALRVELGNLRAAADSGSVPVAGTR
jgi:hypothetical protein